MIEKLCDFRFDKRIFRFWFFGIIGFRKHVLNGLYASNTKIKPWNYYFVCYKPKNQVAPLVYTMWNNAAYPGSNPTCLLFFKTDWNDAKVPSGRANVYKADDMAYDSYYLVSSFMGTTLIASCASWNLSHIYVKILTTFTLSI